MSTEMSNEDIDRMFAAITQAVLGIIPMEEAVAAMAESMKAGVSSASAEEWPEIVLEDILDAEYIGEE